MPEPLFVLAPYRSFTSVVCAMLGQHPQMFGLPELNLFVSDTMRGWLRQPGYGIHLHGVLRTVAHVYFGEQSPRGIRAAWGWLYHRLDASTASVYHELADYMRPAILVDKSPSNVESRMNVIRMSTVFPRARYLHLLRHPRSYGESILKIPGIEELGQFWLQQIDSLDYSTDPPTVDPQLSWYMINNGIREFVGTLSPDRSFWMRGEDIIEQPAATLRRVTQWLGLRDDDDAIEQMLHPERSPFACLGPPGALLGNDPKFLSDPKLRARPARLERLEGALPWRSDGRGFHPHVQALAREFGYV